MNQEILTSINMAVWWIDFCVRARGIIISGCANVEYRNRPHQWFLPMAVGVGIN